MATAYSIALNLQVKHQGSIVRLKRSDHLVLETMLGATGTSLLWEGICCSTATSALEPFVVKPIG